MHWHTFCIIWGEICGKFNFINLLIKISFWLPLLALSSAWILWRGGNCCFISCFRSFWTVWRGLNFFGGVETPIGKFQFQLFLIFEAFPQSHSGKWSYQYWVCKVNQEYNAYKRLYVTPPFIYKYGNLNKRISVYH